MTDTKRLITDCFPIIDTLGNVMLVPYKEWCEFSRLNRDRITTYGRDLTLQQLHKFMSDYRKGRVKLGDEFNGKKETV